MSESSCDEIFDIAHKPSNLTPNNTKISTKKSDQNTKEVKKPPIGAKNWDKIVKELEEEDKEEEGVDDMFKKLYEQADDDTRRAMMKSMYESKGTTLSMSWKDVGGKYVKPYEDKESEEDKDCLDSDYESDDH